MTRPDTPPTPAPAQDVTARAAEHYRRIDHRKALIADVDWPDHVAKSFQLADLLARDLPSRDEIRDTLSGHPIGSGYYGTQVGADEASDMADAVLALLRGESR